MHDAEKGSVAKQTLTESAKDVKYAYQGSGNTAFDSSETTISYSINGKKDQK